MKKKTIATALILLTIGLTISLVILSATGQTIVLKTADGIMARRESAQHPRTFGHFSPKSSNE